MYLTQRKTHFKEAQAISKKYFKFKDLDINNHYQSTKVM